MSYRNSLVDLLLLTAFAVPGCGSSVSEQPANSGSEVEATPAQRKPAATPAELSSIKAELASIRSGAWEDGDILRAEALLATWESSAPSDEELGAAESDYKAMVAKSIEREKARLESGLLQLPPGFAKAIVSAEARAKKYRDSAYAQALLSIKKRAVARALELAPKLAEVDRKADALRVLTEARELAPANEEIDRLVKRLSAK